DDCFMPLTVGGGVRSVEDVQRLLQVGADKVAINTAAVRRPALIGEAARRFGSQCGVVSIDARRTALNTYEVFTQSRNAATGLDPAALARQVEDAGAGEILLTSIDRDGTMTGYDLDLLDRVTSAVSIPVVASGGAGTYDHMVEAIQHGASAVAAASIFHFTEQTPLEAKRHLARHGISVRLPQRDCADPGPPTAASPRHPDRACERLHPPMLALPHRRGVAAAHGHVARAFRSRHRRTREVRPADSRRRAVSRRRALPEQAFSHDGRAREGRRSPAGQDRYERDAHQV